MATHVGAHHGGPGSERQDQATKPTAVELLRVDEDERGGMFLVVLVLGIAAGVVFGALVTLLLIWMLA